MTSSAATAPTNTPTPLGMVPSNASPAAAAAAAAVAATGVSAATTTTTTTSSAPPAVQLLSTMAVYDYATSVTPTTPTSTEAYHSWLWGGGALASESTPYPLPMSSVVLPPSLI